MNNNNKIYLGEYGSAYYLPEKDIINKLFVEDKIIYAGVKMSSGRKLLYIYIILNMVYGRKLTCIYLVKKKCLTTLLNY